MSKYSPFSSWSSFGRNMSTGDLWLQSPNLTDVTSGLWLTMSPWAPHPADHPRTHLGPRPDTRGWLPALRHPRGSHSTPLGHSYTLKCPRPSSLNGTREARGPLTCPADPVGRAQDAPALQRIPPPSLPSTSLQFFSTLPGSEGPGPLD